MILSTLGRLLWVPVAFLLSGATAAFVLVTLGMERITQAATGRGVNDDSIGALFELARQALLLYSGLTLLPALLVVIVGEVARIRSAFYYVIGGGLALVAVPLLARIGQGNASLIPPTAVWQVFATAGFAGGYVYWLLAGRRA